MKAFVKKQIGRIRFHSDNSASPPQPTLHSEEPNIPPGNSNIVPIENRSTRSLPVETENAGLDSQDERLTEALDDSRFMQVVDLMAKFGRFRILRIGGANAGKATILQRICNSTDNPEIYNVQGKKANFVIERARERGLHDIKHVMVSHDSPGLEVGRGRV